MIFFYFTEWLPRRCVHFGCERRVSAREFGTSTYRTFAKSFLKHACAANQWSYWSKFWSETLSTSIVCVCEQRGLWRACAYAQARMSLHCSPMRLIPKSRGLAQLLRNFKPSITIQGTYHISEQCKLIRACISAQSCQSLRCSLTNIWHYMKIQTKHGSSSPLGS